MTLFHAFLLGAVQGITEFLPISSTAHVTVLERLLEIPDPGKAFNIFLNVGTLLAIAVFFRQQIRDLFLGAINFITGRNTPNRYFFLTVLLSSLPTIIVGFIWEIIFQINITSEIILSGVIILFSIILYFCDRNPVQKSNISRRDSLWIGLVQPLAFVPGVSRLGICLSMMRYLKYSREESFKYSMILSIPPVLGVCSLKLMKILWGSEVMQADWMSAVGSFSAFIFGLLSLSLVIKFLRRHTLLPIIFYRLSFGLMLLMRKLASIGKFL
jgi:undecaprenyl-diphosphatase